MAINIVDDNQPDLIPDEGLQVTGEQSFESFGESLPESSRGSMLDDAATTPTSEGSLLGEAANVGEVPIPPRVKRVAMSRKMRKAMDKLKSKAASLPIVWFQHQAKQYPEWALDEDEQELLRDSVETVFEVLDINIEIAPLEWTLTSIWWIVGYPILAFAFLFLSKKSLVMAREQREGGEVAE